MLLDPMVLENAVRRYETCWLPLVAAHAATRARSILAPPLDVAWIWLLHALDSTAYARVHAIPVLLQQTGHISKFACWSRSCTSCFLGAGDLVADGPLAPNLVCSPVFTKFASLPSVRSAQQHRMSMQLSAVSIALKHGIEAG